MEKALFSVSCTTCRARLAVRNKEAIGEILECPKCGSMVLVFPPEGWVFQEEPPPAPAPKPAAEKPLTASKIGDSALGRKALPVAREAASEKAVVQPPPVQLPTDAAAIVAAPPAPAPPPAPSALQPASKAQAATVPVPPSAPPPEPVVAAAAMLPLGFTPFEQPEVVAGETFLSVFARSIWGRVAVLAVSGLLGLAGVVACTVMLNRPHASDLKPRDENAKVETADPQPPGGSAKPALPLPQFNRRWLPEQTLLLVDLKLSHLPAQPPGQTSLAFLGPWWQPASEALLHGLHLGPEQIRRLTWAATDPADPVSQAVVVIELEEGNDAVQLLPAGDSVMLGPNHVARQPPPGGPWRHPLLAVDKLTLVTGNAETLKQLVARSGDAQLQSAPIERLLKKLSPGGDLSLLADLSAPRTAAWQVPSNLLDVWPAGKERWHKLCSTPLALGLSVQSAGDRRCEVGLVCNDEMTAEKIRSDIEKLVPAAIEALPAHVAALKNILPPQKFPSEVVEQYKRLLDDLLAATRTVRCNPDEGVVRLQFGWGGPGFLGSAATFFETASLLQADWLAAARAIDENRHRGLLSGLLAYVKTENPPLFPQGAAVGDSLMLAPQTRLSWIAELLPYLGHEDWHVKAAYNWNSAQNNPFTQKPLPEVVNPVFGPDKSSGYPVTHYVGVAGVGRDAAQLPAGDPRAGVFGYGRQTRQQDLDRGGAHTIAVLGVQGQCGPWAQGGPATVRALTQRPYCNGPDGFGSGQPDGMLAGMADGSVRFLSKDIDPHVMEQLAEVHGEPVDVAALEPKAFEGPNALELPKPPAAVQLPGAKVLPPAVPEPKLPPAAKPALSPKLVAMLKVPIANIALPSIPLVDAVQLVAAMGAVPVSFDPDAMQELGVSLHDLISIDVAKTTVGRALSEVAAKRNLAPIVENGQVVIASPAEYREGLRMVPVDVADLTARDPQAATTLAALLQRLVAPESWQVAGGRGTVEVTPDVLRITQTGQVHYQIMVFCEKLRLARGLPAKSNLDPKKLVLATRTARAKGILGEPANVIVNAPTPLEGVLEQFKHPAGSEIFVDGPALAAIGSAEKTIEKFKADSLPQGEALRLLLEPRGLAWRAVDGNTLQVTTQKVVAARMELEFYPLGKLLAGQPPGALIERIKAGLKDAAWGEGGGAGVIRFDPPSQCLIVLQSQPVQMAIEALLAEKTK